jgi:hypothetical protein
MQGYNSTCNTSIESIAKRNLPTSIITNVMSLNIQYNLITINNNHTYVIEYDHNAYKFFCFNFCSTRKMCEIGRWIQIWFQSLVPYKKCLHEKVELAWMFSFIKSCMVSITTKHACGQTLLNGYIFEKKHAICRENATIIFLICTY